MAYNLLLLASYELGEFSQMYPLARGTSPWVVALISVVVLSRDLALTELLGVLAVSGGLIALVFIGGRPNRKDLPAIAAAVLTGLTIAAYTVIDGVGVMHAPLFAYTGWMFLLQGPPIAASRETSIVFGALIGAIFLGERLGARRAVAAGAVLAGVLLIALP